MENTSASRRLSRVPRKKAGCILLPVLLITGSSCIKAQPVPLKRDNKPGLLSIAYFIESANHSINSLNGLLKKDNYRNKIALLNNPTNNELGFNLKTEILEALKPLLEKAKKTDHAKFHQVIDDLLSNPEENGLNTIKKYLPAASIFSTVLSLVSSLVITEKKITKDDLNQFIAKVQQYFGQYEKLNEINERFTEEVKKLLEKAEEIKEDLKEFLVDCISTLDKTMVKATLNNLPVELLMQTRYDPQKLQPWLDTAKIKMDGVVYPPDAPTTVKLITSAIKKLQKEFESVYNDNYAEMKKLLSSLSSSIVNIDQAQLDKTSAEIDQLYNDSRQADVINLNLNKVDERMNTVCRIINSGK